VSALADIVDDSSVAGGRYGHDSAHNRAEKGNRSETVFILRCDASLTSLGAAGRFATSGGWRMVRVALLALGTWTSVSFLFLSLLAIGAWRTRGQPGDLAAHPGTPPA
jgi:hypothetical protein